jgi:hypothetical protein
MGKELKIYQASYDVITITALAENKNDLFAVLKKHDDNFVIENRKLKYKWNSDYSDGVFVEEIPFAKGIIHAESH